MTASEPSRPLPNRRRRGQAMVAALFWIGGALLFFAPFLRDADRIGAPLLVKPVDEASLVGAIVHVLGAD